MKVGGPRLEDPTRQGCRLEGDLYKSCACLRGILDRFDPEFKRIFSTAIP